MATSVEQGSAKIIPFPVKSRRAVNDTAFANLDPGPVAMPVTTAGEAWYHAEAIASEWTLKASNH